MESRMQKLSDSAYFVVDILSMCQTVLTYDPITAQQSMVVTATYGEEPPTSPVAPEPAPLREEEKERYDPPPEQTEQCLRPGQSGQNDS